MIVHNGEPFIRYNLENLYPHAHEIIIVEGAVEKFRHAATPDGHSLDRTVEIIKSFPDTQGKIKLIQRDGFWPEKDEMSNAYMEQCTGDYIWQVDVDEFYKSSDIESIIKLLSNNPDIDRIDVKTVNFWHCFRAVINGASYLYGADEFRRIFRFRPGYRYLTHRPPTVIDPQGKVVCSDKMVSAGELKQKYGILLYHYSYVFSAGVRSKSNYYAQMGWGNGCEDGAGWVEKNWEKFKNPLRVHLIKFPPSWITPFEGKHPDVIETMIREIDFREDKKICLFLKDEWRKYANAGDRVTDAYLKAKDKKIGRFKAAAIILANLFFPGNMMALRADMTILEVLKKL